MSVGFPPFEGRGVGVARDLPVSFGGKETSFLMRAVRVLLERRPQADKAKCIGCGLCARSCPRTASDTGRIVSCFIFISPSAGPAFASLSLKRKSGIYAVSCVSPEKLYTDTVGEKDHSQKSFLPVASARTFRSSIMAV